MPNIVRDPYGNPLRRNDKIEHDKPDTITALRAENERLRAALMYAAKELELLYFFAVSNGIAEAGVPPHVKARAALEEKQ